MPIRQVTRRLLKDLAAAIVAEPAQSPADPDQPDERVLALPFPRDDAETIEHVTAGRGWRSLRLVGNDVDRYLRCLRALSQEPELEHLTPEERDRELGRLVVGLWRQRERYRQPQVREQRLKGFLGAVAKPQRAFEVLFVVDGLRLADGPLRFGNVSFFHFDQEQAAGWGIAQDAERWHQRELWTDAVGRTVGVVTVRANAPAIAIGRGEAAFDTALNALRACVAQFGFRIWDEQLLQRRGKLCAVRPVGDRSAIEARWSRGFARIDLDLRGDLLAATGEQLERLRPLHEGHIQGRLRDQFVRAPDWIGSSITRERHDDKVVDLCTALECFLTTRDDPRKGEAIALRAMLLGLATDGAFWHPAELLALYSLRSEVVHGSARGVCGESEYGLLRNAAFELLGQAIALAQQHPVVTRPLRLLATLETQPRLDQAIRWLAAQTDEASQAVLAYAQGRLDAVRRDGNAPTDEAPRIRRVKISIGRADLGRRPRREAMPRYEIILVLAPPRIFGLPDDGWTVFEAGPAEHYSPAVDSLTGNVVGHGTLSRYRPYDRRLVTAFEVGSVHFSLEDNFLWAGVDAASAQQALELVRGTAARFCPLVSISVGVPLSFGLLQLTEDDHPVILPPRLPLLRVQTYDLTELAAKLQEAGALLDGLPADPRLDQALRYYADAGTLYRLMTEDGLEQLLVPTCFLHFWKALATVVGEPGEEDHQSRYKTIGLGKGERGYYARVIAPLHRVRNKFDVAHTASLDPGSALFVSRDDVERYRKVAGEAIRTYTVWLARDGDEPRE